MLIVLDRNFKTKGIRNASEPFGLTNWEMSFKQTEGPEFSAGCGASSSLSLLRVLESGDTEQPVQRCWRAQAELAGAHLCFTRRGRPGSELTVAELKQENSSVNILFKHFLKAALVKNGESRNTSVKRATLRNGLSVRSGLGGRFSLSLFSRLSK